MTGNKKPLGWVSGHVRDHHIIICPPSNPAKDATVSVEPEARLVGHVSHMHTLHTRWMKDARQGFKTEEMDSQIHSLAPAFEGNHFWVKTLETENRKLWRNPHQEKRFFPPPRRVIW